MTNGRLQTFPSRWWSERAKKRQANFLLISLSLPFKSIWNLTYHTYLPTYLPTHKKYKSLLQSQSPVEGKPCLDCMLACLHSSGLKYTTINLFWAISIKSISLLSKMVCPVTTTIQQNAIFLKSPLYLLNLVVSWVINKFYHGLTMQRRKSTLIG